MTATVTSVHILASAWRSIGELASWFTSWRLYGVDSMQQHKSDFRMWCNATSQKLHQHSRYNAVHADGCSSVNADWGRERKRFRSKETPPGHLLAQIDFNRATTSEDGVMTAWPSLRVGCLTHSPTHSLAHSLHQKCTWSLIKRELNAEKHLLWLLCLIYDVIIINN